MKFLYLGRQPVLNSEREVSSYLLRFNVSSIKQKLAQVNYAETISKLMHTFHLQESLEGKKGWVKIDGQSLLNSDLTLLSKDIVVFYLMRIDAEKKVIFEKIDELIEEGYSFVLDDPAASAILEKKGIEYLTKFSAIVFDGRKGKSYVKILTLLKSKGIACVIKNLSSLSAYQTYKSEGFDLFMGNYFKEPAPIKGHEISSSRMMLLDLLRMIRSDVEMEDIVATIKLSPDISLQLLQYINSANTQTVKRVESIKDATALLGRKKLMSWVTLSLYSASESDIPQVLIDSAMMRGHLMELLCDLLGLQAIEDQAFLVGLLSISDAIFKVYLHSILKKGKFSTKVQEALLEDKGDLAKLLKIAKIIEDGNMTKLSHIAQKLKVPVERFPMMLDQVYSYIRETKQHFGLL